MTQEDYKEFIAVLCVFAEIYQKELSEAMIEIFWATMKDELSLEDFRMAGQILLKTGKFWPKPAEFLEIFRIDSQGGSVVAWSKVLGAAHSVGMYKSVVFDDPAIHKTIESMGGWPKFCQMEENEWTRKEFEKIYKAFSHRCRISLDSVPKSLIGITETTNSTHGFKTEKPVTIGDLRKIEAWNRKLLEEKNADTGLSIASRK